METAALAFAILVIGAFSQNGQSQVEAFDRMVAHTPHRAGPLTVTRRDHPRFDHASVSFRLDGEIGPDDRVVLKAQMLRLTRDVFELQETDSQKCPALWSVFLSAQQIDAPTIHLPRPEPQPVIQLDFNPLESITEDATYTLRSAARTLPDKWTADLMFSSGGHSPLAQWMVTAEAALEQCWGLSVNINK